jgi:hypothetical protein
MSERKPLTDEEIGDKKQALGNAAKAEVARRGVNIEGLSKAELRALKKRLGSEKPDGK